MFEGNIPISLWGECILDTVYLINRTPSGLLQNKTPFEILFGKEPELDHLRIFGCLCNAYNKKSKGHKFASRSQKCAFVGYPNGNKGGGKCTTWKLEIFVSRDVKLHENEFPFAITNVGLFGVTIW